MYHNLYIILVEKGTISKTNSTYSQLSQEIQVIPLFPFLFGECLCALFSHTFVYWEGTRSFMSPLCIGSKYPCENTEQVLNTNSSVV